MTTGYSGDKTPRQDPPEPRADGPTIEEYVRRGYLARTYPPTGYAAVDSPGLAAYKAWREDEHSAVRHGEAATALGVTVGELEHGRAAGVASDPWVPSLTQELIDTIRAENLALSAERGICGVSIGATVCAQAPGHGDDHVPALVLSEVEQARRAEPNLTPAANADLAAQNQSLAAEHGVDLGAAAPVPDAAARQRELTERRQNDPGSLTEVEAKELAHLEQLAGVVDNRTDHDAATMTEEERQALEQTERLGKVPAGRSGRRKDAADDDAGR